jgi:hypothetical protein
MGSIILAECGRRTVRICACGASTDIDIGILYIYLVEVLPWWVMGFDVVDQRPDHLASDTRTPII